MLIGGAYAFTFFTLGMTYSAAGAFAACTMWSLIATFRAPENSSLRRTVAERLGRLDDLEVDEDLDTAPNGN